MLHLPTWAAKWKREGFAWFKKDTDMFTGLVDETKAALVRHNAFHSTYFLQYDTRIMDRVLNALSQDCWTRLRKMTWIR